MPAGKKPAEPVKTQEELDEEELREVEAKIQEVLGLMSARHSRDSVDDELVKARARVDEHRGSGQSVYHQSKQGHVATTMHTHTRLELAGTLKTRIRLGQYAGNLEDSLRRLSERHVEVLERILERSRY
jgi:hypothetical protein